MPQVSQAEPHAVEVVKGFFETFGKGNISNVLERLTDDVEWLVPGDGARVPWTGERHGREVMRAFFETVTDPKIAQVRRFELHRFFADGDDVVVLGRFGYHYPGSGRDYEGDFAIHFTVRGGKIARYQIFEDSGGIAAAYLGHDPTPVPGSPGDASLASHRYGDRPE